MIYNVLSKHIQWCMLGTKHYQHASHHLQLITHVYHIEEGYILSTLTTIALLTQTLDNLSSLIPFNVEANNPIKTNNE